MVPKLIAAAAILALTAGFVHAQGTYGGAMDTNTGVSIGSMQGSSNDRTPEELARDQEIERKYQETIKNKIPDKKVANDPWKSFRSAPAAK